MRKKNTAFALLASFLLITLSPDAAWAQAGRDYIYIVGSSTVYPFATVVAERFGRNSRFRTPKVESTGSGGGIKLFCDGVGTGYPDVVNSSRKITQSEFNECRRNGVDAVIEVKFGHDGIVLANATTGADLRVSRHQLYLALAKKIPAADGQMVENPHRNWRDIDAALPNVPIEVYGPPPTSGTRDAFVRLVFEHGCRETAWLDALESDEPQSFRSLCHPVREDGAYVEAGENDNLVVQKLQANPSAYGVLGFSFLDQNASRVKAAMVDGQRPTFDTIASAEYPLSRPLFFYVKKAHVAMIPGFREYLDEFMRERTWGDDGYLSYRGLVPLAAPERQDIANRVGELRALTFAQQ